MQRIFFDTEFVSLWNPQIMSIGFASDKGSCYYEIPYNDADLSRFSREVVVPLLSGEPVPRLYAANAIRMFLRKFPEKPELVCDFIGDWWLLRGLIPEIEELATPRCALINSAVIAAQCKEMGLAQHNALNDARALHALYPPLQLDT